MVDVKDAEQGKATHLAELSAQDLFDTMKASPNGKFMFFDAENYVQYQDFLLVFSPGDKDLIEEEIVPVCRKKGCFFRRGMASAINKSIISINKTDQSVAFYFPVGTAVRITKNDLSALVQYLMNRKKRETDNADILGVVEELGHTVYDIPDCDDFVAVSLDKALNRPDVHALVPEKQVEEFVRQLDAANDMEELLDVAKEVGPFTSVNLEKRNIGFVTNQEEAEDENNRFPSWFEAIPYRAALDLHELLGSYSFDD